MVGLIVYPAVAALAWFVISNLLHQQRMKERPVGRYWRLSRHNLRRFNLLEYVGVVFAASLPSICLWLTFRDIAKTDTEHLSGRIASKHARVPNSCSHCTTHCTARGEDGNCTSSYTTCDHDEDYDWYLLTDYAEFFPREGRINIARVDPQGVNEPPAFTAAYVGQPVTTLHSYENLLRAGGDQSVFGFNPNSPVAVALREGGLLPPRTVHVYEGWALTPRYLYVGPGYEGARALGNFWTDDAFNIPLMEANADVGTFKQGNLVIIVCDECAQGYADGLLDGWNGGSKNDINVIIGVSAFKPTWAAVRYGLPGEDMSEEIGQGNNTYLAETLTGRIMQEVDHIREDAGLIVSIAHEEILENFNRKPNKDFAKLEAGIHPPTWAMWFMYGLSTVILVALCFYFEYNDPFGVDED